MFNFAIICLYTFIKLKSEGVMIDMTMTFLNWTKDSFRNMNGLSRMCANIKMKYDS